MMRGWPAALLLAAGLAAAGAPGGPARAQGASDPAEAARAAAAALAEATEALRAAQGARDRIAALTRTIQGYEAGLAALRDGVRRLRIREAALRQGLEARREEVMRLLGALGAIERLPAPALLLHPEGPLGTARLGLILADVAPAIEAEADRLRRDLTELATLRGLQEGAIATLQEGLAAVTAARTELARAVAERRDLPRRQAETPEELARLAAGVETLAAFADLLADTRIGPPAPALPFAERRGSLPLPVRGTILRRGGEADAAGIRRPGLVVATLPRALVTAPADATIRYRGPLLDYGNVIILEPGDGYLIVLAGLGEVYGEVGEVLPEGAPVGLMGGREATAAEFLAETGGGAGAERTETLYIELRRGAEPVDPDGWFAETGD